MPIEPTRQKKLRDCPQSPGNRPQIPDNRAKPRWGDDKNRRWTDTGEVYYVDPYSDVQVVRRKASDQQAHNNPPAHNAYQKVEQDSGSDDE